MRVGSHAGIYCIIDSQSPTELEQLKGRYERLSLLYHVGNVIHSTLDPQEALQLIVNEAVRVMRASSGSVVLINPTTNFLEIQAAQRACRKMRQN